MKRTVKNKMKKIQVTLQATDRTVTQHVTSDEIIVITIYQAKKTFDDRLQPVNIGSIKISESTNQVYFTVSSPDGVTKSTFFLPITLPLKSL